MAAISLQCGFGVHSRYVIPALPYCFVWCSECFQVVAQQRRRLTIAILLLMGTVLSSARVFPHSLSYFNEIAGGPTNGGKWLLDSNISCGQDLLFLRQWIEQRSGRSQWSIAAFSPIDCAYFGIRGELPPAAPQRRGWQCSASNGEVGPLPGWYVIDVNYLYGSPMPALGPNGTNRLYYGACDLQYFRRFKPIDRIGYSMYAYHISIDDANRVRRQLQLPELASNRNQVRTDQAPAAK